MSRLHTYVDLAGRTVATGDAHFNFRRGQLTAIFSYDRDYIALPGAYAIDPALRLTTGSWPLPQGLPGAFSDAAPDRWGRNWSTSQADKRSPISPSGSPRPLRW